MSQLKGACIIGQSGGPTSVINASAYGAIKTALESDCITKVLGARHGIKGVLEDDLIDMGKEDPQELEMMKYTPSSALGSCRYKLKDPDEDDTDYKRILEIFKKYDVRYFFHNGGNDSMDTCNKISKFMLKNGYESVSYTHLDVYKRQMRLFVGAWRMNDMLAKLIVQVVVIAANYFASKFWIFRRR